MKNKLLEGLIQQKGIHEDFSYYLPNRILFGIGVTNKIGELLNKLNCKKILIITDKGILKSGIIDFVNDSLKKFDIKYEIYDKVIINPTIESIEDTYFAIKEVNPDGLIGIGGGSVLDTAKVASLLDSNNITLPEALKGNDFKSPRNIPLIAVETAAGTSAEITLFSPITDTKKREKLGFGNVLLIPDFAICDPLLTVSLPPKITAETGIDCLSHALEAYVAKKAWPVTDALALEAIKLVFENLRKAVNDGKDIKAREGMLMANIMAGMAFPYCGVGMVHGFAEPLSGVYNLAHGLTIGVMMPYVEKFNISTNYEKFRNIANAAGENIARMSNRESAEQAIKAIVSLNKDVKIPLSLKEVGVKEDEIPILIGKAFNHGCMDLNPVRMTEEDVERIYIEAYRGTLINK